MSQLVRLEGKHSTQNAHCAVEMKKGKVKKACPVYYKSPIECVVYLINMYQEKHHQC